MSAFLLAGYVLICVMVPPAAMIGISKPGFVAIDHPASRFIFQTTIKCGMDT